MSDILARLDAAIGGPDRRSKTGRVRKTTPTKVETALLLDAKAEIERLRTLLKQQKAEIVEWLEGQGQPGYASQIFHTKWGGDHD
jgi:hypothetical protein